MLPRPFLYTGVESDSVCLRRCVQLSIPTANPFKFFDVLPARISAFYENRRQKTPPAVFADSVRCQPFYGNTAICIVSRCSGYHRYHYEYIGQYFRICMLCIFSISVPQKAGHTEFGADDLHVLCGSIRIYSLYHRYRLVGIYKNFRISLCSKPVIGNKKSNHGFFISD